MTDSKQPEPWLRGPVAGICGPLQPAAHAFIMALEDCESAAAGLSTEQLWARPGGVASPGFHLAHLTGSTDRLLTYARGDRLSDAQKAALGREASLETARPPLHELIAEWRTGVERALAQLASTPEASLADDRFVGRAQLPSTVMGLLFHAAEHAARHTGQLVTTVKIVRAGDA